MIYYSKKINDIMERACNMINDNSKCSDNIKNSTKAQLQSELLSYSDCNEEIGINSGTSNKNDDNNSDNKNVIIRVANIKDIYDTLYLDKHLEYDQMTDIISQKRILVAAIENKIVGVLRWNLFWDLIPFCNLLYIEENHRNLGYGALLMNKWEDMLKAKNKINGANIYLVSTQSDERAQVFYRKLGYRDCGALKLFEDDALEIILVKKV